MISDIFLKREREREGGECCVYFAADFKCYLYFSLAVPKKGKKWVLGEMKLIASLPP